MEAEATFTLQQVAATAVFLYLCTTSAIFPPPAIPLLLFADRATAPFAIDLVKKVF
jgi:hypothetical protein